MKTTKSDTAIKPHYSYGSGILAATALSEKIKPWCRTEPTIIGRLAEGHQRIRKIEIECVPIMEEKTPDEELVSYKSNQVIEQLDKYYHLEAVEGTELPVSRLPSAIAFKYMTIPAIIHFTEIEE
jgi:hypothetical protein